MITSTRSQQMFDQASAWEAAGDRRAIFLGCYARMTAAMIAALEAGRFANKAWVGALLERFADYYFLAVQAHDAHEDLLPEPWRLAFAAVQRPGALTLQHLFLGVNAHINYDLVLALNDLLREEWPRLSPAERQERYADHCRVNEIIAETVDAVQDEVVERYTPALRLLDAGMGRLDEWLVSRLIARWRDQVWREAHDLLQLADPEDQEAARRAVEESAAARARLLLEGGPWRELL